MSITSQTISEKSLANLTPWKPGQSGNPLGVNAGRPRGLVKLMREALSKGAGDAIIAKMVERANDGDMRAAELLLNYTEGKPLQANINVSIDERVLAMDDDAWEEFKLREDARRAAVVRVQLDPLPTDQPGAPTTIELRSAKPK